MKTLKLFSTRYWYGFLLTALLTTACQKEEGQEQPAPKGQAVAEQNATYDCFLPIYIFTYKFNAIKYYNNCYYSPGNICVRVLKYIKIRCWLPENYFERFGPVCLSCPEEIAKLIPRERIPDFRKPFEAETAIDWKENSVLFPLTKGVVGLQFYSEGKFINKSQYSLPNSVSLSAEEQRSLGVSGTRIPAGTYPVVFNEQTGTYNAIVAVR